MIALVLLGLSGLLGAQQTPGFYYVYDEAGRLVGVVDSAGNTTTYTYDALGNILSIARGTAPVSILEFSPNTGPVGTRVTIQGGGFSATASQNAVTFNGVAATVLSATPNQIVAVVPAGATTGPIRVTSPAGSAVSTTSFTVGPGTAPTISGFTPVAGAPGAAVAITGTNFETASGGNKVSFNGFLGSVSSATTTTINAVVPATATSGHITVSTPNGRTTSSGDFFVPPSPYTGADVEVTGRMAIGETRNVTITQANKIGMLVFDGAAGQRIALSINLGTGLSGGGCDAISIRRPDGSYLVGSTSLCSASNFIDLQVLPVAGTYAIMFDAAGAETGTATLTLHDVPADASATIVPGGAPVTLTTTVPGQNMKWSFSGTAGQRISLKVSFGATCNDVAIQNPDGTALLASTLTCSSTYFSDVRVLPAAGVYTITVNPRGTIIGNVTATLYDVPPDAAATLAPDGSPVALTTTVPGQNAQWTFNGTAGQRISLKLAFSVTCNDVSIQNPDGTMLLAPTLTCSSTYFTDVRVLPATGTYVVTINPRDVVVGNFTATLYEVPADAAATLAPDGSPVVLTTTVPGQNAQWTFNGTAGQRVSLKLAFSVTCNDVSIQNPDGTMLLAPTLTCSSTYFTDVRVLPATGTYVVTVNPRDVVVGNFTATLYEVPADAAATLAPDGSPVALTTTVPGQNVQWTFNGTAGQRISLKLAFSVTCNDVSIQNPDGTMLLASTLTCSSTYFSDVRVLPATGTYVVTVNPRDVVVGNFTATLYEVPADATATLAPDGSPVALTTTVPGQNVQWTFNGTAGQRISLKLAFSVTCNDVSIQNPDGTMLLAATLTCSSTYFSEVRVLPATGTYVVTVNPRDVIVGNFTATLYDVPGDATSTIVAGGSPVTLTTTVPGQNAQWTFSGTAGQRISLNLTFSATCNDVSIQNPDGTALLASTLTCSSTYFSDVRVLPATGTYTITANPRDVVVENVTATLYDVPADATGTITVGGSGATVTTTAPGQNAAVTFSGLASQAVTVRITSNTMGSVTVTLQKPDGSTQTSSSSSGASFNLASQTLAAAGTYTIFINPNGTNTGSINVAVTTP